ncbi:DUF4136 domain-containing protein [Winogradskyella jejuensis]|uniref:DUF4136 domain-containing protein n=1 Tax=Winogradskyella jejuensis TaxID=1089305 RepID=A0A1M5MEN9_9FLAO|nr:DUF4136 domain-containing protein [Winogradskyella jejuensis]SHG75828.1 protein of unknown function [Winogradskyella jejuensis]
MKKLSRYLLLFAALILVSCATKNVKTEKYTDKDLSSFKTFAYLPNTTFSSEEFNTNSDQSIEESLVATMNTKMIENGFIVDKDNPDLLVLLTTSNDIKGNFVNRNKNKYKQAEAAEVSTSPNYATVSASQYKRYFDKGSDELSNRPYKEGSLIVEVFDRKSKELVWLGIADDFKAHISDQTLRTRMINEIFKEFPVK